MESESERDGAGGVDLLEGSKCWPIKHYVFLLHGRGKLQKQSPQPS